MSKQNSELSNRVKQYQNDELCQKWSNNIPLHILNAYNDQMIYSELSQDIRALCEYFSFLPVGDITAYVASIGNGDYSEVYVTEYSAPYDNYAIYHPLSYYL